MAFYYAGFKYEIEGYKKVIIDYRGIHNPEKSMAERIEKLKSIILEQLQKYDFTEYSDVIFAAKSIRGTALAGWAEEKLNINQEELMDMWNKKEFRKLEGLE